MSTGFSGVGDGAVVAVGGTGVGAFVGGTAVGALVPGTAVAGTAVAGTAVSGTLVGGTLVAVGSAADLQALKIMHRATVTSRSLFSNLFIQILLQEIV
jgi:hypothetical protein